jgi:hypothetical protein
MSATRYVVLHTINGFEAPTFQSSLAHGAKYGWDTENIQTAQVWTSLALAEKCAEELNAKIPQGMRSMYHAENFWRAEPLTDWA